MVMKVFRHATEETWYNDKLFYELEELVRKCANGKQLWAAGAFIANESESLTEWQYDELCELWFDMKRRLGEVAPSLHAEDLMFSATASRAGYRSLSQYQRNRVLSWAEG